MVLWSSGVRLVRQHGVLRTKDYRPNRKDKKTLRGSRVEEGEEETEVGRTGSERSRRVRWPCP